MIFYKNINVQQSPGYNWIVLHQGQGHLKFILHQKLDTAIFYITIKGLTEL